MIAATVLVIYAPSPREALAQDSLVRPGKRRPGGKGRRPGNGTDVGQSLAISHGLTTGIWRAIIAAAPSKRDSTPAQEE